MKILLFIIKDIYLQTLLTASMSNQKPYSRWFHKLCELWWSARGPCSYLFCLSFFMVQVRRKTNHWNVVHEAFLKKNSAVDVVFELLNQLSQEFVQRFLAILWSLWKHRNLKLCQDVTETCTHVVDRACNLMEDWYAANTTTLATSWNNTSASRNNILINSVSNYQTTTTTLIKQGYSVTTRNSSSATRRVLALVRWQHPQWGRLKYNVDASFLDQLNIGIWICDDESTFVVEEDYNRRRLKYNVDATFLDQLNICVWICDDEGIFVLAQTVPLFLLCIQLTWEKPWVYSTTYNG